jgi:hydrogenase maturation protease
MASTGTNHRSWKIGRLTVIGVGNPDRGDDAAGLDVVRALEGRLPHDVDIVENHGSLNELMTAMEQTDCAILIDATQSGAEPGTIHEFDAANETLPIGYFRCSTHAFGVAEAIELSRTLGNLPRMLLVFGIEGRDFSPGARLSGGIREAVEKTSSLVVDQIEFWRVRGEK